MLDKETGDFVDKKLNEHITKREILVEVAKMIASISNDCKFEAIALREETTTLFEKIEVSLGKEESTDEQAEKYCEFIKQINKISKDFYNEFFKE